jgi:hypothetical protein
MVCGHEWCWYCGMSKANKFHKAASIFCELIAAVNFNERIKLPWVCKILIEMISFLLFPVILLIAAICLTFFASWEATYACHIYMFR